MSGFITILAGLFDLVLLLLILADYLLGSSVANNFFLDMYAQDGVPAGDGDDACEPVSRLSYKGILLIAS